MTFRHFYRFPLAIILTISYILSKTFKRNKKFDFDELNELEKKGYVSITDIDSSDLERLKDIDSVLRKRLVNDSSEGSLRLNNFHKEFEIPENFKNKLISLASNYLSKKNILLEETQYQVSLPSKENPFGYGWHVDDYDNILKFFLFLTPVNNKNGPLRLIPKTERFQNIKEVFIWLWLTRTKDQYYADDKISDNTKRNKVAFLSDAISMILIDTSSLHSSSILEEGERRVMVFTFRKSI